MATCETPGCGKTDGVSFRKRYEQYLCHACVGRKRYHDKALRERCVVCEQIKPIQHRIRNEKTGRSEPICNNCYYKFFAPRKICRNCGKLRPVDCYKDAEKTKPLCVNCAMALNRGVGGNGDKEKKEQEGQYQITITINFKIEPLN
jgi:hypothetical protein